MSGVVSTRGVAGSGVEARVTTLCFLLTVLLPFGRPLALAFGAGVSASATSSVGGSSGAAVSCLCSTGGSGAAVSCSLVSAAVSGAAGSGAVVVSGAVSASAISIFYFLGNSLITSANEIE